MKQTFLLVLAMLSFSISIYSQSLSNPESITFDEKDEAYYVSNTGSGEILKIDKNSVMTTFVDGYASFLGVKLSNGVIYSAENIKDNDDYVRGFDVNSGELVFSLSIPQSIQLNDIEIDNKGILYVSDRGGDKVYQINIQNKKYSIIDSTIKTPNGLFFNKENNSLLVCNTVEKSNVYEIDLTTNEAKLLIEIAYPNLDGISMDESGCIYLTSWSLNWEKSILLQYKAKQIHELLTNNSGMADIEFNKKNKAIAIAKYLDNAVMSFKINQSH